MQILFIILLTSFVGFNLTMMIVFRKVFPSLSDMYYSLPAKWRKPFWFLLFTFWSISTMIIGQSPFLVAAGFGIALVGCAPAFRKEENKSTQERNVHVFGAAFSGLMSQIYIFFELMLRSLSISVIIAASLAGLVIKKNRTYWIEIILFASTFHALSYVI